MGMTWGQLALALGFKPDINMGDYLADEFDDYSGTWVAFRQWAGYSWDSDHIRSDGPVSTDKALQLLLQRLAELNVLRAKED